MSVVSIVLLLVVIGVVVALTGRHRGAAGPEGSGAAGTVRRGFTLLLLAVGVGLSASGVSGLISVLVPGGAVIGGPDVRLASALSSALVGIPLATVMGRSLRRRLPTGERRTIAWSAYLTAMSVIAAGFTLTGTAELLSSLPDVPGEALGSALAWGIVWWLHRRTARDPELSPLAGPNAAVSWESSVGLFFLAGGAGTLLAALLGNAYDRLSGRVAVGDVSFDEPGAALAAGAVAWTMTWLLDGARRRPRTAGLETYELSVGVLGGLVTTIVSVATIVFAAAEWAVGSPETDSATVQFSSVPSALAAAVVGSAVWWYHRRSAGAADIDSAAERSYRYVAAAIGLGAGATGVGMLVTAFLASFAPRVAGPSTFDAVLGGLTTVAVGAPFWWANWRFVERAAAARPETERASGPRRVYLTGVVGVAATAAIGAAVTLLTSLINSLLAGDPTGSVAGEISVPAGIVVAAGAVAAAHGRIWRTERAAGVTGPRHVTLIGADTDALAEALRAKGARVVVYRRGEPVRDAADVGAALAALDAPEAVVLLDGEETLILPVERS